MRILDILADKLDLSAGEYMAVDQWVKSIEANALTMSSVSNITGGGARAMSDGNVDISLTDGVTLRNPLSGERTIYLDSDGDAWFGSNTEQPSTTSLFIISNDQNYNGEGFGAGDLLVGDNSSGKANMWWDVSTGKLIFRSGTTEAGSIGTGGIDFLLGSIGGWNFNATQLYDDASTIVLNSSVPSINVASGNVVLNSSGITAVAGAIGGWTLGATTLTGGGIVLDAGNEKITVGSGSPNVVIDGANALVKSSNFSDDASGWQIDKDGNAQFNNIKARGAIQTAVFEYNSVSAVSGAFAVTLAAGTINEDATTGATFTLKCNDAESGQVLVAQNDVLRIKYWNGTEIVDIWVTAGAVSSAGGVSSFTATLQSGGTGKAIQEGSTFVNYGQSAQGIVFLEAGDPNDGTQPVGRMRIATHAGSPWTTQTNQVVVGDLYNTYGAGANHYYGIGVGDFATGNYLRYNHDNAGFFELASSSGKLKINSDDGLVVVSDTTFNKERAVTWRDPDDTEDLAQLWYEYDVFNVNYIWLKMLGDGANNNKMILWADVDSAQQADIQMQATVNGGVDANGYIAIAANSTNTYAFGSGLHSTAWDGGFQIGASSLLRKIPTGNLILDHLGGSSNVGHGFLLSPADADSYGLYLNANSYYDGSTWRAWQTGKTARIVVGSGYTLRGYYDTTSRAGGSATTVSEAFRFTQGGDLGLAGGLYVGAVGPATFPAPGEIYASDSIMTAGTIRTEGTTDPSLYTNEGVEVTWESTKGRVLAYGRGPSVSGDLPLELRGSKVTLNEGGTDFLTVDGGDVYTQAWADYSGSSTTVGWSSFAKKEIYYKTIGDLVFVTIYLEGTANNATTTFRLPYSSINNANYYTQTVSRVFAHGTWRSGLASLPPNSNTCVVYADTNAGAMNSSGPKTILTSFFYQRA